MVRIATFGAAFLDSIGAISPVMALDKATITHFVFVDDFPLIHVGGTFQHGTV